MPREKKDAVPVAIKMDREIYERLTAFCEESGMPKTVAIERAIAVFTEDWNKKQKALAALEDHK